MIMRKYTITCFCVLPFFILLIVPALSYMCTTPPKVNVYVVTARNSSVLNNINPVKCTIPNRPTSLNRPIVLNQKQNRSEKMIEQCVTYFLLHVNRSWNT